MNLLFSISLMGLATAEPIEAYAIVEPPVIPFHRQASYTLVVEAPADIEVQLPQMTGRFGGLDVYGPPERSVEVAKDERRRVSETYTLDPIFIGDYVVEPATISYGDNQTVVVPSPVIRVRDLTEDEREAAMRFEPNAGPISPDEAFWADWRFWTAFGVFLALLLAALAYYVTRRRRRSPRVQPTALPWDVAYGRLRELDLRQLPEAGQWEPYYVELSDILRHYIEDRFQLHAPEETTPEFLAEAAGSGLLSAAHHRLLERFLRHSDRVKFARYQPTLAEMEGGFAEVLGFVDETVPKPEPAQEDAAA